MIDVLIEKRKESNEMINDLPKIEAVAQTKIGSSKKKIILVLHLVVMVDVHHLNVALLIETRRHHHRVVVHLLDLQHGDLLDGLLVVLLSVVHRFGVHQSVGLLFVVHRLEDLLFAVHL